MKRLLCLLVLALAGCGSVGTAQPSPTPSSGALTCRLPVAVRGGGGGAQAAFIQFPQMQLQPATGPSFSGSQSPSSGGPAYDQALATWVPVPPADISPDGARYAYSAVDWTTNAPPTVTHIHVVDVRTGADREVFNQGAYDIAAFTTDGIYLVHHLPGTDASNGLWLLDPDTGAIRAITTGGIDWNVGASAGWSGDLAPGDTAPGKFPADRLLRLDLHTGSVAPWFTRPGLQVQVFGFDAAGHPLVVAGSETKSELWLVTGSNAATLIQSGPGWSSPDGLTLFWPAVTDSHGIWINSNQGIYLYRASKLDLVYPASPSSKIDFISGGCR
jgi:hypothetical protein